YLEHATNRGRRDLDLTLRLPQLGEPGVRLSSRSAGLPVCLFGLRELSTQAMELAPHVLSGPDGGVARRLRQALARLLCFVHGARPGAAELQNFGAMHEADTAVGDQSGLRFAPPRERRRPFLRPAQIEGRVAGADDGAVDEARQKGGNLSRH